MQSKHPFHISVIGCGSIGKRHIKNLQQCGVASISAMDISESRRNEVHQSLGIETYSSIDEIIEQKPDAAMICTPNSLHIQNALQFANAGCHLFIEKPLSHTMQHIYDLIAICDEKDLVHLVGCNMRFHPGLQTVRSLLQQNGIGNITSAEFHVGQYLPDWHPWEDYRHGYSARKDLGGGIILDAIHEIDYARWLLGPISSVVCFGGTFSHLEINTEDTANILVQFSRNTSGYIHLDYVQRAGSRHCKLIGDEGTIVWDNKERIVKWFLADKKEWQQVMLDESWETNQMYLDETHHFIQCLHHNENSEQTLVNASDSLQIALAAKQSMTENRIIHFKEPIG